DRGPVRPWPVPANVRSVDEPQLRSCGFGSVRRNVSWWNRPAASVRKLSWRTLSQAGTVPFHWIRISGRWSGTHANVFANWFRTAHLQQKLTRPRGGLRLEVIGTRNDGQRLFFQAFAEYSSRCGGPRTPRMEGKFVRQEVNNGLVGQVRITEFVKILHENA